ncbi:MAG: hypothetical protein KAZ88_01140 [Acidimicrobiia bacterium]|nr:hypothetical protein [Acidimicrobiia bacterium]MBP8179580.1 hypothetical protein [Acidimicrobiia bacterium]
MNSLADIRWKSVAAGAANGLLFLVIAGVGELIHQAVVDDPCDSSWSYLLFAVQMFGYLFAGYVGARYQPERPLTHGALAALGAVIAGLVLGAALSSFVDTADCGNEFVIVVFSRSLFAVGLGLVGATFGQRALRIYGLPGDETPRSDTDA